MFFKGVVGGGFGDFDMWVCCFVKGDVYNCFDNFFGWDGLLVIGFCCCKGDCRS